MNVKNPDRPLVSCIMPTYNRRAFVPHAIRYFLRQDYENKELIIIDDGTDNIDDLVPRHPSIRYYSLPQKITLGAKLNLACQYAKGDIVANWDDDDWYASWRLTCQVDALENKQTYICGINKLLYYDLNRKTAFQYIYPPEQRTWLLGSSLCYKKEYWSNNLFADINVGMDGLFVWRTSQHHIRVLPDHTFSVHMIHDSNVSPKKTDGGWWHGYPLEEIQKIMNDDWPLYNRMENTAMLPKITGYKTAKTEKLLPQKPVKNIYACLVHESEDCIIDMVRNLHYHDPASVILLYNGGEGGNLIKNNFPYDQFGVVMYPDPAPVKWGYLHQFALRCMQFALDNYSFDTLTIVDSDQLCIRRGYTDYIGAYLYDKISVGMLSNSPEKINPDNKKNPVALQAFKEYDLWKPLLQSFAGGENKFVHWTFWPSAVFTSDASRDLVKLFRENKLLQDIMTHTKIWATEEVILPTMVCLLGYEIASNPCNYNFVKYKKSHTTRDFDNALSTPGTYWMHPVHRKYDDQLRKYVREKFDHYSEPVKNNLCNEKKGSIMLQTLSLINRVKKIDGWLSEKEIDLLISTVIKACIDLAGPHNIVEIGSYQGKSTVVLGNVIKSLFPQGKVFAIDPHDGVVGAADQKLLTLPSSLKMFKQNIEDERLSEVVAMIKDFSYNVKWEKSIHMIFIDGLHDYPSVARDFWHFSEWLLPGAYIAFHDYADYYPGVKAFVHELLETKKYIRIELADSLIIIQKL